MLKPAITAVVAFTLLLGVAYPLTIAGLAQVLPQPAHGDAHVVGRLGRRHPRRRLAQLEPLGERRREGVQVRRRRGLDLNRLSCH